jgi:hypothetical protein
MTMGVPRSVRQIAAAAEGGDELVAVLYALATDGSMWRCTGAAGWMQVAPLPDTPGCNAKHQGDREPCNQPRGHRDQHWNGSTRWT